VIDQLQEFTASQRAGQVNRLQREVAVKVKRTRIEEIARGARAQESLDALPGPQIIGRWGCSWAIIEIRAQAASHRERGAGGFHFLEVNFVARSPGESDGILAQAAAPPQGFVRVQSAVSDRSRDVICRNGGALDTQRGASKREPREKGESGTRNCVVVQCEYNAGGDRYSSRSDPDSQR
jgi:hypothetical protein